jgi:hypothetical protein
MVLLSIFAPPTRPHLIGQTCIGTAPGAGVGGLIKRFNALG